MKNVNMNIADSIEANVENAAIHVEQGTDQLAKAREYQVSVLNGPV